MTFLEQIMNGRPGEAELRASFNASKIGQQLNRKASNATVEVNDMWHAQRGPIRTGDEAIPSRKS